MLKDLRQYENRYYTQVSAAAIKRKDFRLVNEAWDLFSEYIGSHELQTPLTLSQFNTIFQIINEEENGKFSSLKDDILKSFRYDSYNWPLVERGDH